MKKSPEELYQERAKRIADVLQMKVPDRIPIEIAFGYFPAKYCGITCEAAYYDYDAWLAACKKTLMDYGVDISSVQNFMPGKVLEIIDPKSLAWPGHGTSPYHSHQIIEQEWMKQNEYDLFFNDPTDFNLRYYLPRVTGVMEPFKLLPALASPSGGYYGVMALASALSTPEIASAISKLQEAGRLLREWQPKMNEFTEEIRKLGFPPFVGGMALAPFDAISDNLRGMKGSMLDLYRQPDKVLEAVQIILKRMIERIPPAVPGGVNTIMIPTHRGSEGFMSLKQFEKFYWPTLRDLIKAIIEKGHTPLVFFEGDYTSRLEHLLEVPKGKIFAHMDSTDIFKAAAVLKGHMVISGNVPCSLLQAGTPDDVREYCKKMIDVCAKDGGFIMSTRSPVDDARPDTLKAMIDFTVEYGRYQ